MIKATIVFGNIKKRPYSLWSLIRSESERRAYPLVVRLAFILQKEKYFYSYMLLQSVTSGAKKKKLIKANNVFLLSLFMSAFASETSESLGDLVLANSPFE